MIKHVTINTNDLEKSIDFYYNIVGLRIVRDLRAISGQSIVFMAENNDETCIELIENAQNAYSGEGIAIGFYREDVIKYREKLEQEGYGPTQIISPNPNTDFFYINDPNGVKIQFIN